ncbi:MAG: twitch domain-containing radical SAM protein [Oligoflexia bacterium]|nr:twitch domain-containing radical SAM protein [Oligoflexia bacterium]
METSKISPTFCVYPWMEFIVGPTSHIKICCIAETAVEDENKRVYNFEEDSIEEYWNSWGLRQIRKKMLAGEKIKACGHCYYQESIGRTSYRQSFNREWFESEHGKNVLNRIEKSKKNGFKVEEPPLYLDIRPGNLCNLKCRMCNPGNSSKIYQEQKEMLKSAEKEITPLIDTGYFKRDEKRFHNWYKSEKIWKNIYKWAPNSKKLYFTGGEPTLIKENWDLIDYLKKNGYSKNIHLIFNLNCTQVPDKLIDTFETFSTVTLSLSIDGYNTVQEYMRYPSKWPKIEKNIIKLLNHRKQNTYFYFTPVVQIYNILDLPNLFKWFDSLQINYGNIRSSIIICTTPKFLDIATLPNNIKKEALLRIKKYENSYTGKDYFLLENLNAIKNVLKKEENQETEHNLKKFYKYTQLLDKKRGNSFKRTFPELNQLFEEDGRWKN